MDSQELKDAYPVSPFFTTINVTKELWKSTFAIGETK